MPKTKLDDNLSKEMSFRIAELMYEIKASDVKILDVTGITTMTDFFVICSSDSGPQTKAIVDNVRDKLRDDGVKPSHVEGYEHLQWVLMDYFSVLVHVFHKDARSYYGIERLWSDAEIIDVEDAAE